MIQRPEKRVWLKRLALPGGLLVLLWAGVTLPNLGLLALASIVGVAVLAIHWRSLAPLSVLLLTPLSGKFVHGGAEWFQDRPSFRSKGYPGNEFFNLDPENRCYQSTDGCVVRGNEWTYETPHNLGL